MSIILAQSVINELAKEIALGKTCYIHRYTTKVTIIDESIEDPTVAASQKQVQTEIEKKIEDYVRIDQPNRENELMIMRDFLEDLPDRSIRKQLSNALNRKNPYRNFMQAVESDIELNQHWKNFNIKAYQQWVSNVIIDAYNY